MIGMFAMKTAFCLFLNIFFFSLISFAASHSGFVKLPDGVERYVEYTEPQPGMPWIVFTNGLVYDLKRWSDLDAELKARGYGILHYYFRGQDWTLKREVEQFSQPLFFKTGLERQDFAEELRGVLATLGISDKVTLVGLSYGAHIAAEFAEAYPEKIQEVVFLAPLVIPLEKYQPQGQWIDWNLELARLWWGPGFYEYFYRQIYASYLEERVTKDRVPSHLTDMPEVYRESLYYLVRAVRDFDLRKFKFSKLGKNSVHFFLAQEEEAKAFEDQVSAFEGVDKKSQGSLIWLPDSSHAIPDSAPNETAHYMHALIQRDPRLQPGRKYKDSREGLRGW